MTFWLSRVEEGARLAIVFKKKIFQTPDLSSLG
jgi:hypothetical protein